jgi:mevalonate kinase
MGKVFIQAPGKLILSGEHSAVYGHPAIVIAVDRILSLSVAYEDELDRSFFVGLLSKFGKIGTDDVIDEIRKYFGESGSVEINSDIPIGSGMGSSAAIAAVLSMLALKLSGKNYDRAEINRYAFELEKVAHGKPSGIDNTTVVYGGVRKFCRNKSNEMVGTEVKGRNFLDRLFAVNTGKPVETTAQMIVKVKNKFNKNSAELELLMNSMCETTEKIQGFIDNGGSEEDFIELIATNQELLEKIGVVGARCREFVKQIKALGGVAKVSGAGGKAVDSGMVIIYLPTNVEIDSLLSLKNYQIFPIKVFEGVSVKINH